MLLTWSVSTHRSSFIVFYFGPRKKKKKHGRIINVKQRRSPNNIKCSLTFRPPAWSRGKQCNRNHNTHAFMWRCVSWSGREMREECPGLEIGLLQFYSFLLLSISTRRFSLFTSRDDVSLLLSMALHCCFFSAWNEICIVSFDAVDFGETKRTKHRSSEFITPWGSIAMPSASEITIHDDDLLRFGAPFLS